MTEPRTPGFDSPGSAGRGGGASAGPGPADGERALSSLLQVLDPTSSQVARMQVAVQGRLAAPPLPSLLREWLAALRRRPFATSAMVLGSAALLLVTSPLAGLLTLFSQRSQVVLALVDSLLGGALGLG